MNEGRDLKARMASGSPVYAAIVGPGNDPFATTRELAHAGYDCIIVDKEHSLVNPETVLDYVRAGKKLGIPILVRPEENYSDWRCHLDSGVNGLMLPLVDTVDQAAKAIDRAFFPPRGHRGYGLGMSPFPLDGLNPAEVSHDELTGYVNDNTILLPQTESLKSVANLDRVLSLDGVDGTVVGTFDLALDIGGIPAGASRVDLTRLPAVEASLGQIGRMCRAHGKAAGIGGLTPEDMARWSEHGYRLFVIGTAAEGNVDPVCETVRTTKRLIGA